jgi:ubiquinone/menaquinone biosynthesis C-methylase UbiE
VFGIDTSSYVVEKATKKFRKAIQDKKIVLFHGSAEKIPLATNSVHRVFHCNSYYYWTNQQAVVREMHRVMQPGASMVSTLNIIALKGGHVRKTDRQRDVKDTDRHIKHRKTYKINYLPSILYYYDDISNDGAIHSFFLEWAGDY